MYSSYPTQVKLWYVFIEELEGDITMLDYFDELTAKKFIDIAEAQFKGNFHQIWMEEL